MHVYVHVCIYECIYMYVCSYRKLTKDQVLLFGGRNDYLMEAEKQLRDKNVYQEVSNSENILSKLTKMSNKMFSSLKKRDDITEK